MLVRVRSGALTLNTLCTPQSCPSFPYFSGFLCFFSLRGFPCFFCAFFHFKFGMDKNPCFFLKWISLTFSKETRKGRRVQEHRFSYPCSSFKIWGSRNMLRKRKGVQKSMGNKVSWTSRPLISLQKEAVLSPCNFATAHLTACILNCYLPLTSRPMKPTSAKTTFLETTLLQTPDMNFSKLFFTLTSLRVASAHSGCGSGS